ncbi:MAG: OmpA family protein [Fusobacteriaceae bacterium]
MKKLFVLGALLLTIVGCSSTQPAPVAEAAKVGVVTLFNENGIVITKDENNILTLTMGTKVLFDFNDAKVKTELKPTLDTLAKALVTNPTIKLQIDGHTDNLGTDAYNQTLSVKRANSVKNYLTAKKVKKTMITVKGYGETKPLNDNSTPELQAENRRADFSVKY